MGPQPSPAQKIPQKQLSPYPIQPISAFYLFLAATAVAAVFAPITDCDETFNYWEPTHYLSHRYGLQTWEYSPNYAIRSWLYVGLHAIVGTVRRLLPQSTKISEFYFVRYVLAIICALCQTVLWKAVCTTLHPRVGMLFLLAIVASPGNFIASAAYLPSAFAMYTAMLGTAAFMQWRGGLRTSWAIFWFALGAVLGWPFSAALSTPFLLEEGLFLFLGDVEAFTQSGLRFARGAVTSLILLIVDSGVNTIAYQTLVIVPFNIVSYNLFSPSGGPNLYGTEPWHFYLRNLALNFNIWLPLALSSAPLFLLHKLLSPSSHGFRNGLRTIVFLSPFYLWLAIFTLQPHKEERFMFPVYPFLALNAAVAAHMLLVAAGRGGAGSLVARIPARVRLLAVSAMLLTSIVLGAARTYGVYTAYAAPMRLYAPLWDEAAAATAAAGGHTIWNRNICFGKDWYRFPTSYFLPGESRAKFVRSAFRGLLPGEFHDAPFASGFGRRSGTWMPTSGLNDANIEDAAKYIDLPACHYLVDTSYPAATHTSPDEPDYAADVDTWDIIRCEPFLDAERTHVVARALWLPDLDVVPEQYRRKWGQHCLLRRRQG